MSIDLRKGQRINLKKIDNHGIQKFCVACKWDKIEKKGIMSLFGVKKMENVDLDLSCVLFDNENNMIDYIYSPNYNVSFLAYYGYSKGKLFTNDIALMHSGDDLEGGNDDNDNSDDNEIIKVDLSKVSSKVNKIVFFLNYVGEKNIDLSKISFFRIRLFEGEPDNCVKEHMNFVVNTNNSSNFLGKRAIIMGGLVCESGEWTFKAIGKETDDANLCVTMDYIKSHISELLS